MKEKISKLYKSRVVEMILILFPVIEMITSILRRNTDLFISPGIIYKALFIIYALVYLVIMSTKNRKHICILISTVLAFCIIHVCVIGVNTITISNLAKLLTFLISVMFIYYYTKDGNKVEIKAIVYCTLIYCALVKFAELTGTSQATYRGDLSLGTKGWFYSGNELSAILSITLPITIMYVTTNISYVGITTLFLQIHTLLSIGTKTSLVSTILIEVTLFILAIIWSIREKSKTNYILVCILFISTVFTICIMPNTASYKFFAIRIEENTKPTTPTEDNIDDSEIDADTLTDFTSLILNGRQDFLKAQKVLYSNTNTLEKLFGTKYENRLGYMDNGQIKTIEIDIYDIIISYGMLGTMLFYFPILLCIFSYIFELKNQSKKNTHSSVFLILVLIIALGISCIAGHVLTSSTIEIFVAYIIGELFLENRKRVKID